MLGVTAVILINFRWVETDLALRYLGRISLDTKTGFLDLDNTPVEETSLQFSRLS